jgi:hypothetical protein
MSALRLCLFAENGRRCRRHAVPFEPFCPEHLEPIRSLNNRELIARAAQAMRECVCLTDDKKIGLRPDMGMLGNFGNYFNALLARGYSYEEAMQSISSLTKGQGTMDDLLSTLRSRPKWRRFEKVVAAIHRLKCEGALVQFDEKIIGQLSKRKRQCDVTLRFSNGYYDFLLVVECKDKNRPVKVEEVEALCQKLRDIRADKGVIVSAHGFQAGAVAVAEKTGVDLFTLKEIKGDWTARLRQEVIRFPFPVHASFDHGEWKGAGPSQERHITFHEVVLLHQDRGSEETLADIFANTGEWLIEHKVALPVDVELEFDRPRRMRIPGTPELVPVRGMKIRFQQYVFQSSRMVDLPPTTTHYHYSDILRCRSDKIKAEELKSSDPDLSANE